MFTNEKISAEEFNDKLSGGQVFSIVVPNDSFELSLLRKVLIDELHLMFEGEDYDKFGLLCDYIWYDDDGRFFFDLSEDPEYTPDKLSFYINVFRLGEVSEEICEECGELFEDETECDYEFYVYSHYKGVMKIDLSEAINIIMSNKIQKI